MLEESPPLAMTAYTARSRWPCDLIKIAITPLSSAIPYVFYVNQLIDVPAHLDQLATGMMGNDWDRGFLSRWGWVRQSSAGATIDVIRPRPDDPDPPADCHIIYDLGEFLHMLDMINMGEFPFEDMDMEFGTPPDTDSEEAPIYNFQ